MPPFGAAACVAGVVVSLTTFARVLHGGATNAAPLSRGLAMGLAYGLGANLVVLRFVPTTIASFSPLPWVLGVVALVVLAAFQAVPWAMGAVGVLALARRGAPLPLAFAALLVLVALVPVVFPWTPVTALALVPELLQGADLVGERGLAALLGLLAGGAAMSLARPAWRHAAAWLFVLLALLVFGIVRIGTMDRRGAPTVTLALVQPGFRARERWEPGRGDDLLQRLGGMTARGEAQGAALTLWPEAAYPFAVAAASRRCPASPRAILGEGVRGPVLTGVLLTAGQGAFINAAAVCDGSGALSEPAAKRHLLLFGERVPFAEAIPWLRRVFVRGLGMQAGTKVVTLQAGDVWAGVLNCFEDTLPEAAREVAGQGAVPAPNLLVNLTNDAWFTGTAEPESHFRASVVRAVETRRDLVRAVNGGPTAWVDAAGRVRARTTGLGEALLVATPALRDGEPTFYVRLGDGPTALALIATLTAAIAFRWNATKRRGRRAEAGRPRAEP